MSRVSGDPESLEVALGPPSARLRGAVRCYQGFRIGALTPVTYLRCPDGLVSLVVSVEGKFAIAGMAYESPFCGPRTRSLPGEPYGAAAGVQLALAPWAAYQVLGVPIWSMVDNVAELADVAPELEAALVSWVRDAKSWPERFAAVDGLLVEAFARGPRSAPEVVRAWRELSRTAGQISVSALADHVGWSERHLESRFREQIGYSPKMAARVLRVRRARRLLAGRRPLAEIALVCGYYDQAHLCREFRALTGYTPTRLARLLSRDEPRVEPDMVVGS